MTNTILSIEGMHCASCASRIEKQLKTVPGVLNAFVNLASQKAYVQTEDGSSALQPMEEAVHEAGYSARLYQPYQHTRNAYQTQERRYGWRLLLGGLLGLPLLAHHFLTGIEFFHFSPWTQFLFAAPLYFIIGWPFHESTLKLISKGQTSMDTLISLGSSVSFFASLPVLWGYPANLYFDATGLILFFVTLGRFLENRSKQRVNRALEKLINLNPRVAHVIKETHQVDLPVEMVGPGDHITVRPGEAFT
jgi:Cu+-exporting ATPase